MSEVEEDIGGAGGQRGKLVCHRCGYLLWVQVLTRIEGAEGAMVVVAYRSAMEAVASLPLYACPQCGESLRLWWMVPT